jgi:hypothetical protein
MDWCDHHAHGRKPISRSSRPRITPWERKFFEELDESTSYQVICAADLMGISYLLIVCCQFAIENHHEWDVVSQADKYYTQALSTTAMEHILLEHALHRSRRSISSAMQSPQGRMELHKVQHLERNRMLNRNLSYPR